VLSAGKVSMIALGGAIGIPFILILVIAYFVRYSPK